MFFDRRRFLAGSLALIFGAFFRPRRVQAASAAFGTALGSFNGVVAYSNSGDPYKTLKYVNGYCTGYEYECVEFAARYYFVVYGMRVAGGYAKTWFGSAGTKGLRPYSNGGTTKPAVGDIFAASYSNGHVAICREVGANYVILIMQNWNNNSTDCSMRLNMTVTNGKYSVQAAGASGLYVWQGWLRK